MKCVNEADVGTAKGALNGLLLSKREGGGEEDGIKKWK
jgi:hypothetical protein